MCAAEGCVVAGGGGTATCSRHVPTSADSAHTSPGLPPNEGGLLGSPDSGLGELGNMQLVTANLGGMAMSHSPE